MFTDALIEKDSFVVEYAGELISISDAELRETVYEQESNGCYLYYFQNLKQHLW